MIKSLGGWFKQCPSSYSAAYRMGFQREIAEILGWSLLESNSSGKKAELLELARSGADRPSQKSKLGMALNHYTSTKKGNTYDPEFTKQIRELAPNWFVNSADLKKAELLELARSGADKPSQKSKLGMALSKYTRIKSRSYDPDFTNQIRELRPNWFLRSKK